MKSVLLGAAGLSALLFFCDAAAAQTPLADATAVDQVIVTGEKAERSVQETLTSISVTSRVQLERETTQDLFDIVGRTANVTETFGPAGITIRGVSNTGVSGGGSGGLATVYVDGAAIPERVLNGAPLDMWDIGQVEILRGPQSTLQGRNALAGAVIVTSQDPTWDWSFKGRVMASDADDRSVAVAGGGPIVPEQLAFRVALEDRHSDGFIYNPTRQTDDNPLDAFTARAKLLWTPSALPDLKVRLTYLHSERQGGYIYAYSRTDRPDYYDHRINTSNDPNDNDNTTDIFNLQGDYALTERIKLVSVTSWSRSDNHARFDGDNGPATIEFGKLDEENRTISQEFRLNYRDDRLQGLVGVYFAKRERDSDTLSRTQVTTPRSTLLTVLQGPPFNLNLATATAAANLYVGALPVVPIDYTASSPEKIETAALFADGAFAVTPKLSIVGGFRYDRERNTLAFDQTAAFAGAYPDPTLYGPYAPIIAGLNQVVGIYVAQANASQTPTHRDFEAFLPKLGVKYAFTDTVSASLIVQRGYRSGGSTVNIARSTVVTFDPEYTWNYEAALRSSWLDGALTVNLNAYYVDWTDQQVQVYLGQNSFDYQTVNAGKSHLYGAELETAWKPDVHFSGYASIGYSHTKFDDFEVPTGVASRDLSGSEFAYAPHWTATVGGDYRWSNGLTVNLNASYRAKAFSGLGADQGDFAIDSRTLVNGRVGYEADHWGAYLYARNIFDEHYAQFENKGDSLAILGDPRVVGISLETRW